MPRQRLGVVVLVPPPVDAAVDALRRACGDGSLGRVPAHITLVPPVNVREDRIDDALTVVRDAAAKARPFRLTIGPAASFLPENPVLYLAVGGDGVEALHRLRERVLVEPLARPLAWPFVPHVTILDEGDPAAVDGGVAALAAPLAEVSVEAVHVLREERDDDGVRVWRPVASAAFGGAAVVGRGGLETELAVSDRLDRDAAAWFDERWATNARDTYADDWAPERGLAVTGRHRGEVVGAATGHTRGHEAYLARLLVDPAERGTGVGSRLLAAFAAAAADRGATELTLRTAAGSPAEGFYRRHGFATVAPLPRWRHGRDFVQLRRAL